MLSIHSISFEFGYRIHILKSTGIPYREKFRLTKVPKISHDAQNVVRRNMSSAESQNIPCTIKAYQNYIKLMKSLLKHENC